MKLTLEELEIEAKIRADEYTKDYCLDNEDGDAFDCEYFSQHTYPDVVHMTTIHCEFADWCECWQDREGDGLYELVGIHEIGKHNEEGW